MFTMSRFWERFFYVFSFLMQGSSYLSPRAYAILHRMHHVYSDTKDDPHSPHYFRNFFSMSWNTKNVYVGLKRGTVQVAPELEANVPHWKAFDDIAGSWPMSILWGTLYSCFYFYFCPNLWFLLLLPIHYFMGPIHGGIVNWCGHKYGYQNFDNEDKSRNTLVWDLLLMGELFQNNHHKFPSRPNFAAKWFELDPTYPVVRILGLLRIIRLRIANTLPHLETSLAAKF